MASYLTDACPGQQSGALGHRVGIAHTPIAEAAFLICDELTSSLDVSVQARYPTCLLRCVRNREVHCCDHNLAVVQYIADRVAELTEGPIIEIDPTGQLFENPPHRQLACLDPATDGRGAVEVRTGIRAILKKKTTNLPSVVQV